MKDQENAEVKQPRKRSLTSVTLGWVAERLKRAEKIKKEVEKGTYQVKSEAIAAAIMNEEMKS